MFSIEDIPYHFKRIYLHGENTYSKPWSIYKENDIEECLDVEAFEKLADDFNL